MRTDVRRRCERLVDGLSIPTPFDMQEICDRTGASRGRPIHLASVAMPLGSPCGLWIATDREDIIVVERNISGLHRVHAALHELGHVLHADVPSHSRPGLDAHAVHRLVPEVDPDTVRRAACRTTY